MVRLSLQQKQQRAIIAQENNKQIISKYSDSIKYSQLHTIVYDNHHQFNYINDGYNVDITTQVQVIDSDTVSSVLNSDTGHIQVLNFASFKNPGGGYLSGALAQEEDLCYKSSLYPVLSFFEDSFYSYNRQHLNKALYSDRGLYSPDIIFFNDTKEVKADVITVAAPNYAPSLRYGTATKQENSKALNDRISFVLNIANDNSKDNTTLILGAFGCGVFKQDPYEVASLFKQFLSANKYLFKTVVFAIPASYNLDVFKEVFKI